MQKAREKIRPPKGGQNLVKVLAICHLRYNISWRDNKPFICECPEGVAKFFDTSELLLQRYEVGDNPLKSLWGDMKILSM